MSGDFRLEADPDNPERCRLVVTDPTPREKELLTVLLARARDQEWLDAADGIGAGRTELVLHAPVSVAGTLLVCVSGPAGARTLLTVACEKGRVVATWDNADPDAPQLPAPAGDAAVTVQKPKRGGAAGDCPESLASDVLRAFSTPAQWAEWGRTGGTMTCYGGLTGRRYRLAHRKRQVRRGLQPSVAVALDDGGTFHWRHRDYCAGFVPVWAFDFMVPPPEEVLALKLTLEHREHWLRNAATMPDAHDDLFADPFPGEVAATERELRALRVVEAGARGGLLGGLLGKMVDDVRRRGAR